MRKGILILRNHKCGFAMFMGTLTTLVTVLSLVLAICVILDRKKKKEDLELEEYLEGAIN